ncbi:hypothetical protein MNBD_GAMMA16-857 [hydrothermal vent metagenome]|uniref:Regulatory protein, RpfE type n=1 Tax=hydrothermal vent metagenome TaxID=652676 RepID=A0A3B0ZF65_9ZZZZ
MSVELHLSVPGLLPAASVDAARLNRGNPKLKLLETWLSRAEKIPVFEKGCKRQLLRLSSMPVNNPPIAAIARLGEGGAADAHFWVAVTPAHFVAEGENIVMYGGDDLKLSEQEAQAFVAEFNDSYRNEGWFMEMRAVRRWYLRCPAPAEVQLIDYEEVVGESIKEYLPQGRDAKAWLTLFNEIQMLFYGSALNQQRHEKSLPDINGVWLWGGGVLPKSECVWQQVWSDDVLAQGLAKLSGVSPEVLPATAEECLGKLVTKGSVLISTTSLAHDVNTGDVAQREAKLCTFISNWLQPLNTAIKNRKIDVLNLYLGGNICFRLDASLLRRFWRARKSITHYL